MKARLTVPLLALVLSIVSCAGTTPARATGPTPSSAAAVTGLATTDTAAATAARHVRPVTASGRLAAAYTVTRRLGRGECWTTSDEVGRAYRCISGNRILDPCWAGPDAHVAFCLLQPWNRGVIRLRITGRFYRGALGKSSTATYPWGIELASGQRCTRADGTTGEVGHQPITYPCRNRTVYYGRPDESGARWRIRRATATGGGHYRRAGWATITIGWIGRGSRDV